MPDRDVVIKGLEPILACATANKWGAWIDTLEEAIELLKEQETELCDRCGRRRLKST